MDTLEILKPKRLSLDGGLAPVAWVVSLVAAIFVAYLLYDWYRGYRIAKRIKQMRDRARSNAVDKS